MCLSHIISIFLCNDTATTDIYTYWLTLFLHDALPICCTLESRYDRCSDTSEYGRRHGGGLSAQIDRDFGFAKLVSISAYRKARGKYKFDVLPVYPTLATSETTFPSDSLTQEFQLISPSGGRLQWTLGAVYIQYNQRK